jgi:hypothetical protein
MEILMDLANIITISFILFLLILATYMTKRAYHRRRCIKLLQEYRDSYEHYNKAYLEVQKILTDKEVDPEDQEILQDNVVSLEEYKKKRI